MIYHFKNEVHYRLIHYRLGTLSTDRPSGELPLIKRNTLGVCLIRQMQNATFDTGLRHEILSISVWLL